jgi:hypothetical protein
MADWRERAKFFEDVVYFQYVPESQALDAPLVYVWDLDKTYLETSFESLKGLIRTALEKAFQKRNVPGTNTLVRALISSQGKSHRAFPIVFITASPPQMEAKIHQKLVLDNIRPFGCFFKDNLKNLHPNRLKRLTNHMGYKIHALLELRARLRPDVQQILWGDDSESDAVIYSLYSDICGRRPPQSELVRILKALGVEGQQIKSILALQEKIPAMDPVKKIFINLAVDTDPEYYLKFGRRMVATYDTFQASLDLYQDGLLDTAQVVRIAQDMITNYAFSPDELGKTLEDLCVRRILRPESLEKVVPELKENGLVPVSFQYSAPHSTPLSPFTRDLSLQFNDVEWVPSHIDYLMDYR